MPSPHKTASSPAPATSPAAKPTTTAVYPTLVDVGSRAMIADLARDYRLPMHFATDLFSMFYLPSFHISGKANEQYTDLLQIFPVMIFRWFTKYSLWRSDFLLRLLLEDLKQQNGGKSQLYKNMMDPANAAGMKKQMVMATAHARDDVEKEAMSMGDGWGDEPDACHLNFSRDKKTVELMEALVKRMHIADKLSEFIKFTLHNSIRSHLTSFIVEPQLLIESTQGDISDIMNPEMLYLDLWPLIQVGAPATGMALDVYIDISGSMMQPIEGTHLKNKEKMTRVEFAGCVASHLCGMGIEADLYAFNTTLYQHADISNLPKPGKHNYIPPIIRQRMMLSQGKVTPLKPEMVLHLASDGGTEYSQIIRNVEMKGRPALVITDGEGDMSEYDPRITWIRILDGQRMDYVQKAGEYEANDQVLDITHEYIAELLS